MKLHLISALAVLLAATGSLGQAPATSRIDDLAERFVTIVERGAPNDIEPFNPPEMRQELLQMNPGRAQQIDEYVSRIAQCYRHITEDMPRAMGRSARALGEERLARLVAFLEGPGGVALERSLEEPRTPMPDNIAEEWDRLRPDYGTFMYSIPSHIDRDAFNRTLRCYEGAAAQLGLRVE